VAGASVIARLTGRDRKTVRRLLAVGQQPRPREVASKLDPCREYILARMQADEDPVSNAEVIYDEICARGLTGSRSILKEFMPSFREMSKQKVTERFETPPGKQAQVDWGSCRKPKSKRVQGFVITLGWSRASYLDFEDSQALPVFLACHE
jgi:transposase